MLGMAQQKPIGHFITRALEEILRHERAVTKRGMHDHNRVAAKSIKRALKSDHGPLQEERILFVYMNVEFATQFVSQLSPIRFENAPDIILPPICGYMAVDDSVTRFHS